MRAKLELDPTKLGLTPTEMLVLHPDEGGGPQGSKGLERTPSSKEIKQEQAQQSQEPEEGKDENSDLCSDAVVHLHRLLVLFLVATSGTGSSCCRTS